MLFGFDIVQIFIIFLIILVLGALVVKSIVSAKTEMYGPEVGPVTGQGECCGAEDIVDV